eukprot:scaffold244079_cov40-Attheya_sp.AAC.1
METLNQEWQRDSVKSSISSKTYITRVTERFELLEGGNPLPNAAIPMRSEYHAELDTSPIELVDLSWQDTSLPILEDTILEDTSVHIGAKCVRGIRLPWDTR